MHGNLFSMRMNPYQLGLALLTTTVALVSPAGAGTLSVYISPPATQDTFVGGASTATFDGLTPNSNTTTPYVSPIGTYQYSVSSPAAILVANQYGGAHGTQYMSLGAQSHSSAPITLNLNSSANYFGFWFSAGDKNNGISFYNGDEFLARYTTQTIVDILTPKTGTVTAVNNTVYNNSDYYGNPNDGSNTGETYTYVDIIASGLTFDTIVLDNSDTEGTGFESDNHSVYAGTVTAPGGDVFITQITSVPEPSEYMGFVFAGLLCFFARQHWRKMKNEAAEFISSNS